MGRKASSELRVVTLPELAKHLKGARGAKNKTQAEVSKAAGKNTATYTYWESGTTEPGALALARACLSMGITPNDVLLTPSPLGLGSEMKPKEHEKVVSCIFKLIELSKKSPEILGQVEALLGTINER